MRNLFVVLAVVTSVAAHPGHDVAAEARERREFLARSSSLYAACGKHFEARGHGARAIARRQDLARQFRESRGLGAPSDVAWLKAPRQIQSRNPASVFDTDHHSNLTGITFDTNPSQLFGGNASCLLQPEVTEGPYYVTGEYVRSNMSETQPGIQLLLDVQVIDVNTCEPLPNKYVEFWHANATGVYSGVIANGNGNSNDASNINATFLRGIQPTDDDGVVQMATVFPGHYDGRATHIHLLAHGNATVAENKTLVSSTTAHVGQLFFDQDLITAVSALEPYSGNTQGVTLNTDDSILASEANTTDPFVEYVYADSDISNGIIGWITIGVNSSLSKSVNAAASLGADGGHANSNGGMGGGGSAPPVGASGGSGGPGGNATGAPTGSTMPTVLANVTASAGSTGTVDSAESLASMETSLATSTSSSKAHRQAPLALLAILLRWIV